MDTLLNIFHVKFLEYEHLFMSIRISQMKDHSISIDQAIYATSIVTKWETVLIENLVNEESKSLDI